MEHQARRHRQPSLCFFFIYCLLTSAIPDRTIASFGSIYKITNATSKELPFNDETVLTCEMSVAPDRYQWRLYALGKEDASRANAPMDLSRTDYLELPANSYTNEKKRSTLTIKMTNWTVAGDYQCLAHYGALVTASIPDRITLATMGDFPSQNSSFLTVSPGNTIVWKCTPPPSNPAAYVDYSKDGNFILQQGEAKRTSLIIANVTRNDSGIYKCKATNAYLEKDGKKEGNFSLHLNVDAHAYPEMPRLWPTPISSYFVQKGDSVFLECNGVGTPVPTITWYRHNRPLYNSVNIRLLPGGLHLLNITQEDEGSYVCKMVNYVGSVMWNITVTYYEPPTIISGPTSEIVKEFDNLELACEVRGIPQPKITWLLNGRTVLHDKQIVAGGKYINFKSFEKHHGGQIQCFATNAVGTTYASANLNVLPKQVSSSDPTDAPIHMHRSHNTTNHKLRRKHKKGKKPMLGSSEMIPPSKPTVLRSNDESVVVRWSVPSNNGLQITFFKVQYRELGPANSTEGMSKGRASRWKTNNVDIAPNIRSFEVTNLKADYLYKFRIAAVYSNNDNKLSPKSDRFHLKREGFHTKNNLPIPTIVHKSAINSTSIQIYWTYEPNPNITVDGFLISYMSASLAADYNKVTAEGEQTKSFIITHLAEDTVYDIKMQSYNAMATSDFSVIVKSKTTKVPTETPPTTTINAKDTTRNETSVYWFIGLGVGTAALVLSTIICFITCKWKQSKEADKTRDRSDKPTVEEINHHIQAETNDFDYVVSPKSIARSNGCTLPGNRITITANPLADADNKRYGKRSVNHIRIDGEESFLKIFEFGKFLGKGHFGIVFEVRKISDNKMWASKIIEKKSLAVHDVKYLEREVNIWKALNHPHIIALKEIFESPLKIYLIMEKCYTDLMQLKQRGTVSLSEDNVRRILIDLTSAISYLHKNDIVHRDIKMENILITDNPGNKDDHLFIKLTDFGLSIIKAGHGISNMQMLQEPCGTLHYMSPEILSSKAYSQQCDVWAIGILLFYLMTSKMPFTANNEKMLITKICTEPLNLSAFNFRPELKDLLTRTLNKNPAARITAAEMKQHPWLQGRIMTSSNESHNVVDMMRLCNKDMRVTADDTADDYLLNEDFQRRSAPVAVTNLTFNRSTTRARAQKDESLRRKRQ